MAAQEPPRTSHYMLGKNRQGAANCGVYKISVEKPETLISELHPRPSQCWVIGQIIANKIKKHNEREMGRITAELQTAGLTKELQQLSRATQQSTIALAALEFNETENALPVKEVEVAITTHVVSQNETLETIAVANALGAQNWPVIWAANIDQLANPDAIQVGDRLIVPKEVDEQTLKLVRKAIHNDGIAFATEKGLSKVALGENRLKLVIEQPAGLMQ